MKNFPIVSHWAFLIVGSIVAIILVSTPPLAGQDATISAITGSDLSLSTGAGLKIPLSNSFSLDLNLSSVATRPSSTGEREWGVPPIPLSKPPGSDLQYTRLGVGFSFRF